MTRENLSFEKAFERLEQILETMNTGKTPLEESLSLFEQAEELIRSCTQKLSQAEQKIEMLIKDRNGALVLESGQKPKVEPYTPSSAPPQQGAGPYKAPPSPSKAKAQDLEELPF